ncbi:MAG TPA: hypothetical protein VF121_09110 [Thermoanaerobaculia bacterium]|nr:hypothetical protein [Thermoanaerobaculia bacterium]
MRLEVLFRLLFILYCVEAGLFLVMAPWSPIWDRNVLQIPLAALRAFALHPAARGAVSGFGLVHLVWGAHDLDALLTLRRPRRGAA